MYTNYFHRRAALLLLSLAAAAVLAAAPAFASEPAGRVLTTKGVVTATDPDDFERPLSRNDVVYPGETLRTGEDGRIQVRFRDDALVDLKPNSEFEIERYREATKEKGGSAVMNLLKGALRTITGAIGGDRRDEYAVGTPVATIGIRGTDYSLEFCDAACAGNGRPPGLYGRVDDGSIVAETGAGQAIFSTGDYFFIPEGSAPRRIIAPPQGILVDDEENGEGGNGLDPAVSDDEVESGPAVIEGNSDDLVSNPTYESAYEIDLADDRGIETFAGTAFAGRNTQDAATAGTGFFDSHQDDTEVLFDSEGRIIELSDDSTNRQLVMGDAVAIETGTTSTADFGVAWGRWSGEYTVTEVDESGNLRSDDVSGGMVWAFTDDLTDPAAVDGLTNQSATFTYAGGPAAVDVNGDTWDVASLTMDADFLNSELTDATVHVVKSTADAEFIVWNDGPIAIEGNEFSGALAGEISSGRLSGAFLGESAEGSLVLFSIANSLDYNTADNYIQGSGVLTQ